MAGLRLIDFLCKRFPYKTLEGWNEDIRSGKVVINGNIALPDDELQLKDVVSYTSIRNEPNVATNIETIFEDEYILVVNKPAPLPVHSDGVFILHTLIYMLREKTKNQELRLGHRLDRETTGVLMLAKNAEITFKLMTEIEKEMTEKKYLAITRGNVNFEEKLVSGWMGPVPNAKVKMRQTLIQEPREGYKESSTRFTLVEQRKSQSLLECELLSGRTNQIRTHLESIGYPIEGDKLYGRNDEEYLEFVKQTRSGKPIQGRHLLHAWRLSITHPITRDRLNFEAPIPSDMRI